MSLTRKSLSLPPVPQEWRDVLAALAPPSSAANKKGFIAGGALRDLILGREPKDVDLFLSRDWRGMWDFSGLDSWTLRSKGAPPEQNPDSWAVHDDTICELYDITHKSGTKYQAIVRLDNLHPKEMIEHFDFGLCQIAWDFEGWYMTDHFLEDLKHKAFTVWGTRYPQATLKRAEMFKKRFPGWTFDVARAEAAVATSAEPGPKSLESLFE